MATLTQIRKINKDAKTKVERVTTEQLNGGKVFVLRTADRYHRGGPREYYTGARPATNIAYAKYFTREKAENVQKWAHTGFHYQVYGVPGKQLFLMILQGK